MHYFLVIIVWLVAAIIVLTVYFVNKIDRLKAQIEKQQATHQKELTDFYIEKASDLAAARADAISKSRYVNRGFDAETFSPFTTHWVPKDFKHLGDCVDYLIFNGLEAVRGGATELDSIVILDIKTGNADLTAVQRRIKEAIVAGRVEFAVHHPDTGETRIWSPSDPKGKCKIKNNSRLLEPIEPTKENSESI